MDSTRTIFKGVNSMKFDNHFTTDDEYYQYLSEIKWDGSFFGCKNVVTLTAAKADCHIQDVVHVVNMMRARQQEVSFGI